MSDMNLSEAEQVVQMLKEQVAELQKSVFQSKAARLAEFEADKPRLKAFLNALTKQRVELKKEIVRLQASVAGKGSAAGSGGQAGMGTGISTVKGKSGAKGQPLTEEELQKEAAQLRESLVTVENRIEQAKRELAGNRNRDEQDIWETNLVILQDTRRMQKEELALLDMEMMGRERLAKAAEDKAAAEASGELAVARASERLLQLEARIDRIKQQLFFPAVKGYTFALGSSGIYFGGKDIIVSEISGSYALKAETGLVGKQGVRGARLTLQIGMPQAPPPPRARNSMGQLPVSDSLRLHMTGRRLSIDRPISEEEQALEEAEAADSSIPYPDTPKSSGRPPRPGDLGNSRGKRMAMKFVNKIANKDKYTQGLQGVRRSLDQAKAWAGGDKSKSNGTDSASVPGQASAIRASITNKLIKAKTSAGKGLQKVGRASRQLGSSGSRSDLEDSPPPSRGEVSAYAGLGPTGTAQDDLAEAVADDAEDWTDTASIDDLDSAYNSRPQRSASEQLEVGSSRSGGGGGDASSATGKQGMLVAIRCMEVGLVGEKGSKVPNFALQELSLEMDFQLSLSWQYNPVTGWRASGKPVFEVNSLAREVKGNTVPLPKGLLKLILTMVVPRVLQRKVQAMLPVELGQYLSEANQGVHITGDIAVVGPALSALDADLAFQDPQTATKVKDARKNAAHFAAAQEARNMLGLTPAQASVIAELFGGRLALLTPPRPCTLGALQAYYSVFSSEKRAWEQLGAVWSTAARMTGNVYKAGEPPDFLKLMDGSVAQLARKPVRARLQVTRLEIGVNVDALLDALRTYFVRSAREAHNKGTHMDLDAADPEATLPEGYQPLEVQLEALEAFHTFWKGTLRTFKSKFKEAGGTIVAAADARSFSAGVENVRYEGPLKLEIPVPLHALEADGAFTFELPLPNPGQQETFQRFVDGLRAAMATPVSMIAPPAAPKSEGGELERTASVWDLSPAEWFATLQDSSLGKTWEDAANALGPMPESLGKVLVNGMRVRIKLDQDRLAELLGGMDSASIPGLLSHLGDVACLSFAPFHNEQTGQVGYMLKLESSDAANLSAEAVGLGYRSSEGISPGRLLRTAQALARAIMLTLKMDPVEIKEVDEKMEEVYEVLIREALDSSACIEGLATKTDGCLVLQACGGAGDSDNPDSAPGFFANDIDLAPLLSSLIAGDAEAAMDERIARQLGFGKKA